MVIYRERVKKFGAEAWTKGGDLRVILAKSCYIGIMYAAVMLLYNVLNPPFTMNSDVDFVNRSRRDEHTGVPVRCEDV